MNNFRYKYLPYIIAVAGISLLTLVMYSLQPQINPITVSLFLLLFILFIATFFGSRTAIFASVLAMLSLNFFFLPPIGTLTIYHSENWIALVAFLAVSLTAGQLSAKAKKRAEEAERLYSELQTAFKKASEAEAFKQSEKLKSALLDAVTHDLRTPLTSIKASVTTLIDLSGEDHTIKLDDAELKEFIEIINEETDRLNQFIENIVALAKIEAKALHIRKRETEIEEILSNAVERAKNSLTDFLIEFDLPDDLPTVVVDAQWISEVVYTLLDNAVKYSAKKKEIRISARCKSDKFLEISVEDKGRGVAQQIRSKIFDKFFRQNQDDIHTTSGGIGLGLAIAKGIIESQGGNIRVEDGRDGYITRFVFQIPVGNKT